jgi:hypothetical protein
VYLKRTIYGNPPEEILTFDQDNVAVADLGKLNLAMKWVSPTQLDITYDGRSGTLIYQVALCRGIHITVHDTSGASQ